MITYVRALPRSRAARFIADEEFGFHEDFGERIAWVGISADGTSPVSAWLGPRLIESFGDDESMTPEQGAILAFFIARIAAYPEPWALLVHCDAGISRSAAVATWAYERYARAHMAPELFEREHRHCFPNQHVMRMLSAAVARSG
jgi:hypothetical protein